MDNVDNKLSKALDDKFKVQKIRDNFDVELSKKAVEIMATGENTE